MKMKIFLGIPLSFFLFTAHSQTGKYIPTADEILTPAFAKAADEKKKVMIIFHASWCGWCSKMVSSLHDPAIWPLMEKNFAIVHLTVYESQNKKALENPGALAFLTKYGGADKGLPYWFVFDIDKTLLADSQYKKDNNTGCPASEEEVAYFIDVLKKTTTLTEEELQRVKKRFRQNEQ